MMNIKIQCISPLSSPTPNPRFFSTNRASRTALSFKFQDCLYLSSFLQFHYLRNRSSKVVRGLNLRIEVCESDESDLAWETWIVRALPPALTLEQGLQNLKEAVEKLKLDPPHTSNGICRFQVAVPPSAKALNWFCCQPVSSEIFPQFFLSKEMKNPMYKSLHLNRTIGIFGIGIAASFTHSSFTSRGWKKIKRYLSVNSAIIKPYGVINIDFEARSSSLKHRTGSYFSFIPQIELDEHEDVSILTLTLAWSESLYYTFADAVSSCESSLKQASGHFWLSSEKCHNKCRTSTLRNFNVVEDKSVQMVHMDTLLLAESEIGAELMELNEATSSCQFCIRLSSGSAVASNMLNHVGCLSYTKQPYANTNSMWASLIIEECSRLGLMYFCVAPGSRSSPLAIAASSHPLAVCIVCFDERSLAFHAIGYARGSRKPAVVITSSGTAVSNLLPAVVEASQDYVPLLLLTADRPPELQNAGANQAIDQVNHFGSYVRFFFNLPTPNDHIPGRMVLTTLDSALYRAISSPPGPVHINCPFREPLYNSPRKWNLSCLEGLDLWMSNDEPFTKYIQLQNSHVVNDSNCQMSEVLRVIEGANKGILLLGAISTEDEMWAALLMAKHLLWPVVADILSGLRLRKLLTPFYEIKENILFVDHLDHALLSDSVKDRVQADVVIQIGSRITSKRISQFLEECFPCSYILVDNHPCRHDPSHIVTHRIHSTVTQFADCLLKIQFPQLSNKWTGLLRALDMMVASEISFQIHSEESLTEPHVAHVISEALRFDSALFIGNSMAIRDADMYGCNWLKCIDSTTAMFLSSKLECYWIQVAGNRGASGIDGLLSTSVGFAVGCNKRVLCVIGDVSFLHDTNGLAILNERMQRKPMTILVINNHGGAIFSLLPIADRIDPRVLNQYFYTSHSISIGKLCDAHGVKHVLVQTKLELQDALLSSQQEETDCVIEAESCIEANATFHSTLRQFACQAADHAISLFSMLSNPDSIDGFYLCNISRMEYSKYRISLSALPTSTFVSNGSTGLYREGFILALSLGDGSIGFGEVAPLIINEENFIDIEEQLRFLLHAIKGAKISLLLPLLRGSFSSWIQTELGVMPCSIFPSVRCGLEMALLNALAASQGSSLLNVLRPQITEEEKTNEQFSRVKICALIDSNGTPGEVAYVAARLVNEGFTALKIKVARQGNPALDAAVIKEVRSRVGNQVQLRADANRKWTYEEAMCFAFCVKNCHLQYIEEPVHNEDDIIKFCEETGLPVALDETMENITDDPLKKLRKFSHSGVVAIVVKPSSVGGFENALLIAQWAQRKGKMAVVSAAFESGLGLAAYIQLSCCFELQNAEICKVMKRELNPPLAHGLGTYQWLKDDITTEPLRICCNPYSGFVEGSVVDADEVLRKFKIDHKAISESFPGEQICVHKLIVESEGFSYFFKMLEVGPSTNDNIVVFLHGFLGTGEDWIPIMKAMSGSARCVSVDLPGHGGTKIKNDDRNEASHEPCLSIELVASALCELLHRITPRRVTLVGYSMGARVTLYMALRFSSKIKGAVLISGSPGLKEAPVRTNRVASDDSKARTLIAHGLENFVDTWYAGELWKSLRGHPHFDRIAASRLQHEDAHTLAKVLSDLSTGRQPSMWEELQQLQIPALVIVGERDSKFRRIASEMCHEIGRGASSRDETERELCEMVEVPNCGHAPHLENPLHVIGALGRFLRRLG